MPLPIHPSTRARFYRSLGETLYEWQGIEVALFGLFSLMMSGAPHKLISTVFHHLDSFDARCTMVSRCAEYVIRDTALKAAFSTLMNRLSDARGMRNRLVHSAFVICGLTDDKGNVVHQHIALQPSSWDATAPLKKRTPAQNPRNSIDQKRLDELSLEFDQLTADIHKFRLDLAASIAAPKIAAMRGLGSKSKRSAPLKRRV
jgi:hypothetical protein